MIQLMANIFKNNCKRFRDKLGMTQDEFAEKIGMSRSYVSRFESGHINATLDVIYKICDVFGVSPGQLLDDNENSNLYIPETTQFLNDEYARKIMAIYNRLSSKLKVRLLSEAIGLAGEINGDASEKHSNGSVNKSA